VKSALKDVAKRTVEIAVLFRGLCHADCGGSVHGAARVPRNAYHDWQRSDRKPRMGYDSEVDRV